VSLNRLDILNLYETPAVAAVYDRRFYGNSQETCGLRDTLKPAVIDRRYSENRTSATGCQITQLRYSKELAP